MLNYHGLKYIEMKSFVNIPNVKIITHDLKALKGHFEVTLSGSMLGNLNISIGLRKSAK